MVNLINGVKCTNEEAAFIHRCLFNNFKRNGNSNQCSAYTQHLKEVFNDL